MSDTDVKFDDPDVGSSTNPDFEICLGVASSLLTFPLMINELRTKALLDTGSSICLMRSDIADSLNLSLRECSKSIRGLGSNFVYSLGATSVQLLIGEVTFVCDFVVIPTNVMRHPLILGCDFFHKHSFEVDVSQSRLVSHVPWGIVEFYLRDSSVHTVYRNVRVTIATDTIVPYGASVLVPVQFPVHIHPACDHEFYFDGSVLLPYLSGEPGLLSLHCSPFSLMVCKISGTFANEKLRIGQEIACLSSVVVVDQPAVEISLASVEDNDALLEQVDLAHIDADERNQVLNMMRTRTAAFSRGDDDVGCAGVTQHCIELYDDTPIRQKPRRFPEPITCELERQCEELVALDILDYSKSPWSSPIVPVRKKDGSIRMCIDYRQLNQVTKADRFPIPNMTDLVFGLHGMSYFSTLDLIKGYYQVSLHPDCQEYTAFSTPRHHYEFKRLSFGLKNAPGAFQREMQAVLREFDQKQVLVYIDDILIMSRTFSEHLDLVARVLQTLSDYNIKVKLSKCCWFKKEVTFLGHVVSQRGLRKSDSYMDSVRNYSRPSNVKQLRQFLGVVNFQRKFIPHCAEVAKPLTCLTGQSDKTLLIWTEEMIAAFDDLKANICADLELAYPDYSSDASKLELSTDASSLGAGACLSQFQNGETRVIAYASMSFSRAQQKYSTIERELAAIRWAVRTFSGFLFCIPFVLFTDHRPLIFMNTMCNQNARIMRTLNELAEFDFEVKYRPGPDNFIADTFSRLPGLARSETGPVSTCLPDGLEVISQSIGGGDSMIDSLCTVLLCHVQNYAPCMVVPSATELRHMVVAEILRKPCNYSSGKLQLTRVKLMRLPGNMPSEVFLMAFASIYKLQVLVYHEMDKPIVYDPIPALPVVDASCRVYLQCLAGFHYNPLKAAYGFEPVLAAPVVDSSVVCADSNILDTDPEVLSVIVSVPTLPCLTRHCTPNECKIMVRICDRPFCALVDTGAQISLVAKSVYDLWLHGSWSSEEASSDIISIRALGSTVVTLGSVKLDVAFTQSLVADVSCAVVDDSSMPCCLLFGIDLICSLKASLDFRSASLRVPCSDGLDIVPFVTSSLAASGSDHCLVQNGVSGADLMESFLSNQQISMLQRGDRGIQQLFKKLSSNSPVSSWRGPLLKPYKRFSAKLIVHNDVVVFSSNSVRVPVVPFKFLVEMSVRFHWQMCHVGRNKLDAHLRSILWCPSLSQVAADVATSCEICQRFKTSSVMPTVPIVKIQTSCPFEMVAVDLVKLPQTSQRNSYCLVCIDHYSKWLACVPMKDKSAKSVSMAFEHRILPFIPTVPGKLLSDNGAEFTSAVFEEVLQRFSIQHVYSTPYKPSSNGAVERANRTVIEMLRCLGSENSLQWDSMLAKVVITYNHSWHAQLSRSPSSFLLAAAHESDPVPLLPASDREHWREGHPNFQPFKVGSQVLRKCILPGCSVINKFQPRFSGPYVVSKVGASGLTYQIVKDQDTLRVHHSQLRRFVSLPPYIMSDPVLKGLVSEFMSSVSVNRGRAPTGSVPRGDDWLVSSVWSDSDSDSADDFSGFEESQCEFVGFPAASIGNNSGRILPGDQIEESTADSSVNSGLAVDSGSERVEKYSLSQMTQDVRSDMQVVSSVVKFSGDGHPQKHSTPASMHAAEGVAGDASQLFSDFEPVVGSVQNLQTTVTAHEAAISGLSDVLSSVLEVLPFLDDQSGGSGQAGDNIGVHGSVVEPDIPVGVLVPNLQGGESSAKEDETEQPVDSAVVTPVREEPGLERVVNPDAAAHLAGADNFSFQGFPFASPGDFLLQQELLSSASNRPSLSPVKEHIRACRLHLEQLRQSSRERIKALYRPGMRSSGSALGAADPSLNVPDSASPYKGPRTRSRGLAPE